MEQLDLDLLRTFAVIAETGALSRAATRVGRTQAAISLQVKRLEHAVNQTLLYRHAGNDANAIHIDPAVAEQAGFKGPILAGQNTLGFAARAAIEAVCGRDPTRVRSIDGRFAAPGYNGDRLTTELWFGMGVGADTRGRLVVAFRVVNQDGAVLVDRGRVTIA